MQLKYHFFYIHLFVHPLISIEIRVYILILIYTKLSYSNVFQYKFQPHVYFIFERFISY